MTWQVYIYWMRMTTGIQVYSVDQSKSQWHDMYKSMEWEWEWQWQWESKSTIWTASKFERHYKHIWIKLEYEWEYKFMILWTMSESRWDDLYEREADIWPELFWKLLQSFMRTIMEGQARKPSSCSHGYRPTFY